MNSELLYIIASVIGVSVAVASFILVQLSKRDKRVQSNTRTADATDRNTAAIEKLSGSLERHSEVVIQQLNNHETRITVLEKKE